MRRLLEKAGTTRQLQIGLLVERRYLSQAQPLGMSEALRACGHGVTVIDPLATCIRAGDDGWLRGLDLVIARGRSWQLLCMLSWVEARGVPTINRRGAISAVHNKADMSVALAHAGVPTPRTFLGPTEMIARSLSARGASFPIVFKPLFGDNARGLSVVADESELRALRWPEPCALAQEFVHGDGDDRKLYGIGDEVWAVRKPSPLPRPGGVSRPESRTLSQAEPVPLNPEARELALRCRRVFGLELYGVDCVETPEGLVVIEVNEFPNYTGVPAASERLAEHVVRGIRQGLRTEESVPCESAS